jgi:hypothetical protein
LGGDHPAVVDGEVLDGLETAKPIFGPRTRMAGLAAAPDLATGDRIVVQHPHLSTALVGSNGGSDAGRTCSYNGNVGLNQDVSTSMPGCATI